MAAEKVRVRYAPSLTGEPHIGNIRTALFNWLFARHNGGSFIVRIEDTDQERLVPGAVDGILDGLEWMGIDWDEGPRVSGPYGPYYQSERLGFYAEAADRLIRQGAAYRCYCTRERLAQVREEQQRQKLGIGYDGLCRDLAAERRAEVAEIPQRDNPLAGKLAFQILHRIRKRPRIAVPSDGLRAEH